MAGWNPSWGPGPSWSTERNPLRPTFGGVVARVARELLGRPLFPHQRWVVDVLGEVQSVEAGDPEPGRLAYSQASVLMPRRSGKTEGVHPMVARVCGGSEKRSVWTTAQRREDAVSRWRDTADRIVGSPMGGLVRRKISNSHEELLWMKSGSVYRPFAPDVRGESLHGEEPSLVIVDELWTLALDELKAIQTGYRPSWSVTDGQEVMLSAAGTLMSGALKHHRVVGREAVSRGVQLGRAHFEWCVPEVVGGVDVRELEDTDLLNVVIECHPRREFGLSRSYLAEELAAGRQSFLRSFGGLDDDTGSAEGAIRLDRVQEAAAVDPTPLDGRLALAAAVDPDGLEGSLVAGYLWTSGVGQLEAVERREGTRWMAGRLLEIVRSQPVGVVVLGSAGADRDLADQVRVDLEELGVDLRLLSAADVVAAAVRLKTSIEQQTTEVVKVRILDPRGEFLAGVQAAGMARRAGGFVWVRRDSTPCTMVSAASAALWAVDKIPAPPADRRPFRIG